MEVSNYYKGIIKIILTAIAAIATLVIAQLISQGTMSLLLNSKVSIFISESVGAFLYIMITLVVLKLWIEKGCKQKLKDYKIGTFKINRKWLIVGVCLPILVTGFYLFLPGEWYASSLEDKEHVRWFLDGILYVGIAAGFVEEIIFRGIIMTTIEKIANRKAAVVIPSFLFGILHTLGMPFNIIEMMGVTLAGTCVGIMFSYIALKSHSIWNSGIVHALWNVIIIGGMIHVGDSLDKYSLFNYKLETHNILITGGEFGIESSLIALCGYIVVILIVHSEKKIKPRIK